MSKYIFIKDYKRDNLVIKEDTEVESLNGFICYEGIKLFLIYSQSAKDHIMNNDEGEGKYKRELLDKLIEYYMTHDYETYNDEIFEQHKHSYLNLFEWDVNISKSDLLYMINKVNIE